MTMSHNPLQSLGQAASVGRETSPPSTRDFVVVRRDSVEDWMSDVDDGDFGVRIEMQLIRLSSEGVGERRRRVGVRRKRLVKTQRMVSARPFDHRIVRGRGHPKSRDVPVAGTAGNAPARRNRSRLANAAGH